MFVCLYAHKNKFVIKNIYEFKKNKNKFKVCKIFFFYLFFNGFGISLCWIFFFGYDSICSYVSIHFIFPFFFHRCFQSKVLLRRLLQIGNFMTKMNVWQIIRLVKKWKKMKKKKVKKSSLF
jgi:uncharacterized membrane protein